jgi:Tfp pilus assembly protein PilP
MTPFTAPTRTPLMTMLHAPSLLRLTGLAAVWLSAFSTLAGAQGQPATKPPAPTGTSATAPAQPAPAVPPYTYDALGRRDPFVSLLTRGSDPQAASSRPAGLAGVTISEANVKGIVRDRSGLIAMIQGTGTKTFIVRAGERLMDGSVKAIAADSVVFAQDVQDPLSMVKQKEVRKTVRSADGGRE